jgi:hypothetical protein
MNIRTVHETFRQLVAAVRLLPEFTETAVRNFLNPDGERERLHLTRYMMDAQSLGVSLEDALDVLQATRASHRAQGRVTRDEVWSDARLALVKSVGWPS